LAFSKPFEEDGQWPTASITEVHVTLFALSDQQNADRRRLERKKEREESARRTTTFEPTSSVTTPPDKINRILYIFLIGRSTTLFILILYSQSF